MRTVSALALTALLLITPSKTSNDSKPTDSCEKQVKECRGDQKDPTNYKEACAFLRRNKDCLISKGCPQEIYKTMEGLNCDDNSANQSNKYSLLLPATLVAACLLI